MSDFLTALYGLAGGFERAAETHQTRKDKAREVLIEIGQKERDRSDAMERFQAQQDIAQQQLELQRQAEERAAAQGKVLTDTALAELERFRHEQTEQRWDYTDASGVSRTASLSPEEIRQLRVAQIAGTLPMTASERARISSDESDRNVRIEEAAGEMYGRLIEKYTVTSRDEFGREMTSIPPEVEQRVGKLVESVFGVNPARKLALPQGYSPELTQEPVDALSPLFAETVRQQQLQYRQGLGRTATRSFLGVNPAANFVGR
jgi:hypothetical protein